MFEEGAKLKARHGAENVFDFSLGNPNLDPEVDISYEIGLRYAHFDPLKQVPTVRAELAAALETTFDDVICYGDVAGAAFDPKGSPNLVITARRAA